MPEYLIALAVYALGAAMTAYVIYDTADQARKRKTRRLHVVATIASLFWPLFVAAMLVTNLVGKNDTAKEHEQDRRPLA